MSKISVAIEENIYFLLKNDILNLYYIRNCNRNNVFVAEKKHLGQRSDPKTCLYGPH